MEGLGGPVHMDPYSLEGIDPALDDCCRREVESNRRQAALQATMRRFDVVEQHRRRRNLVTTPSFEGCRCCYDPNSDGSSGDYRALAALREKRGPKEAKAEWKEVKLVSTESTKSEEEEHGHKHDDDDDEDSDDEFDYLLDEPVPEEDDRRRAELEMAMFHREVAQYHGYGTHRQMHPNRVFKAAGIGSQGSSREPPHAVVLHLVDADSIGSASLDLYLEEIASEYPGTIFLRTPGRSAILMDADLARRGSLPTEERDLPALVAVKDGVVANICPNLAGLTNRGDNDEIEPHAVRSWLDRSGVLSTHVPPMEYLCHIRPEEEALMDYLTTLKPKEDEELYDCGVEGCQKAFRHEHVGVKTSEQDGLVVSEEEIVGGKESD